MPPVGAAIGAAFTAISGALAGSTFLAGLAQAAASLALSKLSQKLFGPKPPKPPGQTVDGMTTGELAGETFIVGRWATGGHMVYHGSQGQAGETPNAFYTRVIELAGMPKHNLRGVILKGEFVEFDLAPSEVGSLNDPLLTGNGPIAIGGNGFGRPATNDSLRADGRNFLWLRYHDGTQTAPDAMLRRFFEGAQHPYTADMIGAGVCYAVITYRFGRQVWQSSIEPRFVLDGIPLYDPRKDGSVGGSGAHRHNNPATWEWTANPALIAYNVARGIALPSGDIYGGEYQADDLPLARWVAAMNTCDESAGEDRPRRYTFGAEINVAETEPADLIEACMTACAGQIAAIGGQLIPQVGAPDVPVWSINDEDLSADDTMRFEPIKGLAERFNGVQSSYVAPAQLWEPRNLPMITNADWEAEDGGRRLIADLRLSGVYSAAQASELSNIYIRDERRQRVHQLVLPPDAGRLKVFDTIQLTRPQDGYQDKLVEVVGFEQRTDDLFCAVTLREVDPSDYTPPVQEFPEPPLVTPEPFSVQSVPGFGVAPLVVLDGTTAPRRPALRLFWDAAQAEDVDALRYEIRLAGGAVVASGVEAVDAGQHIAVLLPATDYEVQAQLVADRRTEWTAWIPVTTPDVRLGFSDIGDEVQTVIADISTRADDAFTRAGDAIDHADTIVADLRGQVVARLDIVEPEQRSIDDRLEEVAQQIGFTLSRLQATDQRVSDAGIYLDPDAGTVRIAAFEYLDTRVGEVSIDLDAARAAIELRATFAEVNQAISEAVLDPTQIPIISDLELRVSDVEILADATAGAVTLKADTLTVNGIEGRLTEAEVGIDSLTGQIALKVDQAEFDAVNTRLTTAEVIIDTLDGANITQTVQDTRAQFDEIDVGAFTTLNELWGSFTDRRALREALAFAENQLSARVTEGLESEAQARLTLVAQINNNAAAIQGVSTASADADQALASQIATVQAATGANTGAINAEAIARTNADNALAAQVNTVAAGVGDLSSSVAAQSTAIANLQGITEATYSLRLVGGGASARFEIVATDGPDGPASTIRLASTNIRLDGDVDVTGDFLAQAIFTQNAWITDAAIANARIGFAQIDNVEITNAQISGSIQSDNYAESGGVPTAGFRLDRDTGVIRGVSFISAPALQPNTITKFDLTHNISDTFGNTYKTIGTATVNVLAGSLIQLHFNGSHTTNGLVGAATLFRFRVGTTVLFEWGYGDDQTQRYVERTHFYLRPTAGSVTFDIQARNFVAFENFSVVGNFTALAFQR